MIEHIQLLRNIGQFDSVSTGGQLPLSKMTLVYAENGRGKTTLAAILRSLATGNSELITERKRLSATQAPHVVISIGSPFVFQNNQWSGQFPDLAIFDDTFVAENVCSGIEIEPEHRQHLHELILGAQGVALNAAVQKYVVKVEEHNQALRTKADAIPAAAKGSLTVDAFCALKPNSNIAKLIEEAERGLAAAKSSEAVRQQADFVVISLPTFDTEGIKALLTRDLPQLDTAAVERVKAHLATLGGGGETWVGEGMVRVSEASTGHASETCPFCAQDLRTSPVIDHYRAYFSEAYSALKADIDHAIKALNSVHGADAPAAFERAVRVAVQRRDFWKTFAEIPDINIDTAAITRDWKSAREAVSASLNAKKCSPLEPITPTESTIQAIAHYEQTRAGAVTVSAALQVVNAQIAIVKERAASANIATLTADLARLKATEARHNPAITPLCKAYRDEKAAKKDTEASRDQARADLDTYRVTVFPAYEAAINTYLQKFNAGFRLGSVTSVNNRTGSSCTYNVLINNVAVPVTGTDGGPCFRNTLSAGDRNTLALAFFFASLDQDPQLAQKIVVIDDPMTSLDEHRSLTTIQETRRLIARVMQVMILSHSKTFLCGLWQGADTTTRAGLRIKRDGAGSILAAWDVNQDCITEHDRRHALVVGYIKAQQGIDERAVAAAQRPILESFMRVAYPTAFPPGSLLGQFIGICNQRKGTASAILAEADIIELRDLLDYANKFHHDTNTAYETETINDHELLNFCKRTLSFAQRGLINTNTHGHAA